jgi:hypothetical protein
MQDVSFARFVGTAPGSTTISFQGFGQAEPVKRPVAPPPFPYLNLPSPTQAVYEPDPNTDNVRIAMPPNQWVTGPVEMKISVPAGTRAMGPVPNDGELAQTRPGYLPLHRGWIAPSHGEPIFTLQGTKPGLGLSTSEKWAIAASVLSATALIVSTTIAVLRYRNGK